MCHLAKEYMTFTAIFRVGKIQLISKLFFWKCSSELTALCEDGNVFIQDLGRYDSVKECCLVGVTQSKRARRYAVVDPCWSAHLPKLTTIHKLERTPIQSDLRL